MLLLNISLLLFTYSVANLSCAPLNSFSFYNLCYWNWREAGLAAYYFLVLLYNIDGTIMFWLLYSFSQPKFICLQVQKTEEQKAGQLVCCTERIYGWYSMVWDLKFYLIQLLLNNTNMEESVNFKWWWSREHYRLDYLLQLVQIIH